MKEERTLVAGDTNYFSFHQNWSKLCTLLQNDANDAELKKKSNFLQNA
jgi:hypothetical protein